MERSRNVQRINGEVTHLHQLSGEELDQMRGYAAERIHQGMLDIETIEGEIALRRDVGAAMLQHPTLEATNAYQQGFEAHLASGTE